MDNSASTAPIPEATLVDNGSGLLPASAGWFLMNLADAAGWGQDGAGHGVFLETPEHHFEQFTLNVHVLNPGEPNGKYHSEAWQEGFLVLAGECIAIVEEQERTMRAGDYLHCPPGTNHIFVGAGDGPCAILMLGGRDGERKLHYPFSEVAAKYGASATQTTSDPAEAYADANPDELRRVDLSWIFPGK